MFLMSEGSEFHCFGAEWPRAKYAGLYSDLL